MLALDEEQTRAAPAWLGGHYIGAKMVSVFPGCGAILACEHLRSRPA